MADPTFSVELFVGGAARFGRLLFLYRSLPLLRFKQIAEYDGFNKPQIAAFVSLYEETP